MWANTICNDSIANALPNHTSSNDPNVDLVTRHYLSDLIPKDTVFAFGYEPKWEESKVKKSHYWAQVQELARQVRLNVERKSKSWTEEEQQAWQALSSIPFPTTELELAELGINTTSAFWLYGLGLIPAFVMEIEQPKKLRAWANKHIQNREHGFKRVEHHQGAYWRKEMKRWVLLLRLKGHHLQMSLLPKNSEPILLSYFLREQQKASLSEELQAYFKALPVGRGSGLIKISNLIDMFFGSEVPILQQSGRALGLPVKLFSSCEQDFRRFGSSFNLMSFGLYETSDQKLSILTHVHLDKTLHDSLEPSFKSLKAINMPKRSTDSGSLSMRFNTGALITFISNIGQAWENKPWSCPMFSSFNEWSKLTKRPELAILNGLVGELKGLSLMMHKNTKQKPSSDMVSSKSQTLAVKADNQFDLWIEFLHPAPQNLLNILIKLGQLPRLPNRFYHIDGLLKDISFLSTRLNQAFLSLSQQKLMLSIGAWGESKHRDMIKKNLEDMKAKPSSMALPFLHFALPPVFSDWLAERLKAYQKKADAKTKVKPLLKSSKQVFRAFQLYFTKLGILVEVHVDLLDLQ